MSTMEQVVIETESELPEVWWNDRRTKLRIAAGVYSKVDGALVTACGLIVPPSRGRGRACFADVQEPPNRKQVETAKSFIAAMTRTTMRPICPRRSPYTSYGWKHVAEHWGKKNGMEHYISNGAFIQAAVECGIPVRGDGSGINAYVALRLASGGHPNEPPRN